MAAELTVRDVMRREFLGVSESDPVGEVAQLMVEEGDATAVVVRGNEPVGTLPGTTMLEAVLGGNAADETPVQNVMRGPPRVVGPRRSLSDVAGILAEIDTNHVVVSGPDGIQGLLASADLMAAVSSWTGTPNEESLDDDYDAAVAEETETETMSSQSVCEVCGTLKTNLENVNGQLVCDDCRAM